MALSSAPLVRVATPVRLGRVSSVNDLPQSLGVKRASQLDVLKQIDSDLLAVEEALNQRRQALANPGRAQKDLKPSASLGGPVTQVPAMATVRAASPAAVDPARPVVARFVSAGASPLRSASPMRSVSPLTPMTSLTGSAPSLRVATSYADWLQEHKDFCSRLQEVQSSQRSEEHGVQRRYEQLQSQLLSLQSQLPAPTAVSRGRPLLATRVIAPAALGTPRSSTRGSNCEELGSLSGSLKSYPGISSVPLSGSLKSYPGVSSVPLAGSLRPTSAAQVISQNGSMISTPGTPKRLSSGRVSVCPGGPSVSLSGSIKSSPGASLSYSPLLIEGRSRSPTPIRSSVKTARPTSLEASKLSLSDTRNLGVQQGRRTMSLPASSSREYKVQGRYTLQPTSVLNAATPRENLISGAFPPRLGSTWTPRASSLPPAARITQPAEVISTLRPASVVPAAPALDLDLLQMPATAKAGNLALAMSTADDSNSSSLSAASEGLKARLQLQKLLAVQQLPETLSSATYFSNSAPVGLQAGSEAQLVGKHAAGLQTRNHTGQNGTSGDLSAKFPSSALTYNGRDRSPVLLPFGFPLLQQNGVDTPAVPQQATGQISPYPAAPVQPVRQSLASKPPREDSIGLQLTHAANGSGRQRSSSSAATPGRERSFSPALPQRQAQLAAACPSPGTLSKDLQMREIRRDGNSIETLEGRSQSLADPRQHRNGFDVSHIPRVNSTAYPQSFTEVRLGSFAEGLEQWRPPPSFQLQTEASPARNAYDRRESSSATYKGSRAKSQPKPPEKEQGCPVQ